MKIQDFIKILNKLPLDMKVRFSLERKINNEILKKCPLKNSNCDKEKCMWWCNFAHDCSIPLLAGMFADSSICNNIFEKN